MGPPLDQRPFEAGKQPLELALAAGEQRVRVMALRHTGAVRDIVRVAIAVEDRDRIEEVAEHARGTHARQAPADGDSVRHHEVKLMTGQVELRGGETKRPPAAFGDAITSRCDVRTARDP